MGLVYNEAMLNEIIAPLFTTEWGQRAGWAVLICAALLFTGTFFQTLYNWHDDVVIIKTHPHSAKTTLGDEAVMQMIQQIPDQHLFGSNQALPITSLQIRLVGVIKAVPEALSHVIISEEGKPGKVYQVGDTLPSSGVKIHSITQDGVVLENDGHLEKLPLQRTPLQFQGEPKPLLPAETNGRSNE